MVILLIKKKNIFQRLQNICFDLIPDVNDNDVMAELQLKTAKTESYSPMSGLYKGLTPLMGRGWASVLKTHCFKSMRSSSLNRR